MLLVVYLSAIYALAYARPQDLSNTKHQAQELFAETVPEHPPQIPHSPPAPNHKVICVHETIPVCCEGLHDGHNCGEGEVVLGFLALFNPCVRPCTNLSDILVRGNPTPADIEMDCFSRNRFDFGCCRTRVSLNPFKFSFFRAIGLLLNHSQWAGCEKSPGTPEFYRQMDIFQQNYINRKQHRCSTGKESKNLSSAGGSTCMSEDSTNHDEIYAIVGNFNDDAVTERFPSFQLIDLSDNSGISR